MERVFKRDVKRADGAVRFAAGAVRDYPKDTWRGLAKSLGVTIEDFTMSKEEAGLIATNARTEAVKSAKKSKAGSGESDRIRLTRS